MLYNKIKEQLQNPFFVERVVAFALDLIICLVLGIIPIIGWLIGFAYFILKDSLAFTNYASFGKHIYNLALVDSSTGEKIEKIFDEKIVLRGLILLVPIINLVDIYYFITTGRRAADKWTGTEVIKIETNDNENKPHLEQSDFHQKGF